MTSPRNVAVFIDHHEARIFHVDPGSFDASKLEAPQHHVHRHPKGAAEPHQHGADLRRFFDGVAAALAASESVLVVGPSTAKNELVNHLREHQHAVFSKIVAVETVDHPTDAQLVAHAKRHFHVEGPRVH